ncbi:PfkB family carbohydrate kinase [Noviherbaspirillum saxi]|nr:PfkB family carbohydrate kinase [Noviherbaspirillum saxi]
MIHIAGGTYREFCEFPEWRAMYGSAGRAAAAISTLSDQVFLSTFGQLSTKPNRQSLADQFAFIIKGYVEAPDVAFRYFHCLSKPEIWPRRETLDGSPTLRIEDTNVLRFGAIEGQIVVKAERAVYDPQSAFNPEPFHANSSSAKSLAIVCNGYEASLWTGAKDPKQAASALLANHKADVVVLKMGHEGAYVYTPNNQPQLVAPYMTGHVFSIGSGDVFSAVFAHFWAEQNMDPIDAATQASLATAIYCETQSLPITTQSLQDTTLHPQPFTMRPQAQRAHYDVYLAGPFFTMAQRWLVEEARNALRAAGLKVFSPYHEVGNGPASHVAPLDIAALNQSALVLALIDGLDAGTIYEAGYAAAKGVPVVAFSEQVSNEDLKMIAGNGAEIHSDFTTAIYRACWKALK